MANAQDTDREEGMSEEQDARNFEEFWPVYVRAHRQAVTRGFHVCGTLAGWLLLAAGLALRSMGLVLAAVVAPYAMAWISHFFVEHNRPASFGHPLWSWLADQKMVGLTLAGKMGAELKKCLAEE